MEDMSELSELSEMRFVILLSPILLHKWRVLRVQEMCALLKNYLDADAVEQCCQFHVDNATALRRLRRHLIVSQNNQLYNAILSYCQDKYDALTELVQFMWIDMDEEEGEQEVQGRALEISEKQLNVLMDRSTVIEKLQCALNRSSIEALFEQHLSADDVHQLNATQDNKEAAALLHRRLLVTNRKFFFQQLVRMCASQRDDYKDCADFMKNGNGNDIDAQYGNADISSHPQLRDNVLLSMMDQNIARIIHMENQFSRICRTFEESQRSVKNAFDRIYQLEWFNSAMERIFNGKVEALETKITLFETSQISKDRFPSIETIYTMNSYKWNGLSALLCDEAGRYETIDWNKMGGDKNWKEQWMKIKGKKNEWLGFPPLVLPRDYGECVIKLSMDWMNHHLVIQGSIPSNAVECSLCPEFISIDIQFTVYINKKKIRERRVFKFMKSVWSTLFAISNSIKEEWELPKVDVQVFPLSMNNMP